MDMSFVEYVENIDGLRYVSMDIFDTLIFRTVKSPKQVFNYMYEMNKGCFPDYIDGDEWEKIRIHAEKLAREKKLLVNGSEEVTLKEIYNQMPWFMSGCEYIQKLELEAEKRNCILNQDIYTQLVELKRRNYHLILTSDMYLSEIQIRDLLKAVGVDLAMFDRIFISSEIGVSKKDDGGMYEYIVHELKLKPEQIIHCGDNLEGDIGQAAKKGIQTFYYPIISEAKYQYSFFEMEILRYGNIATELFAIRNIAASCNRYKDERSKWFNIGATILGPLFTYAMEWTVDQAEKDNITKIYPLMREGKLLSKLLKNSVRERGQHIKVEPLYVSRKVVYEALRADVSRLEIEAICETVHYTVREVFSFYNILDCTSEFEDVLNLEISDLRKIKKGEQNLYEVLVDYLSNEKMLKKIRERHRETLKIIYKYFMQKKMNEPFITVDIGWNGRIASGIQRILDLFNTGIKPVNLFICGKEDALKFSYSGTIIKGYVGSFGKNLKEIQELYAFIVEALCMCDEGTTLGYQEDESGDIVPILKREQDSYLENQKQWVKSCQEGILQFQQVYFQYRKRNQRIEDMKSKERELCQIVGRLLISPSLEEAQMLGKLEYDVNMGSDTHWKVINPDICQLYVKEGTGDFFKKRYNRYVEWLSGMNVYVDPFITYKTQLISQSKYYSIKIILFIERILSLVSGQFVLVGAGIYGRDMYKFLRYIQKEGRIESFLDNNEALQNNKIFGIPIYGISHPFKSEVYVICTANFRYIQELSRQIKKEKGKSAVILTCVDL